MIIPTYNEKDNLEELVRRTSAACSTTRMSYEIVIVDDNSPDGTGALAEEMGKSFNVKVVHRAGKLGLSTAVTDGFKASSGSVFVVMDADLSHPPEKISEMVERITKGGADMVVGSRYVEGGHVENWPFHRRLMSKGATLLARGLTKVKDPMSGFFALKREVVDGVELNPVGYKIGLEILVKGKVSKVEEVPITFADRKAGTSKLGASVTLKYIDHCLLLYEHRKPWLAKYFKFALVGGIGTLINLAIFWPSIAIFHLSEVSAITLAFIVADTNNFIWNRWWTFRSKGKMHFQYPQFLIVSAAGLIMNIIIFTTIMEHLFPALGIEAGDGSLYKVFAQLLSIFTVSVFTFFANALWTFGADMRPRSRT